MLPMAARLHAHGAQCVPPPRARHVHGCVKCALGLTASTQRTAACNTWITRQYTSRCLNCRPPSTAAQTSVGGAVLQSPSVSDSKVTLYNILGPHTRCLRGSGFGGWCRTPDPSPNGHCHSLKCQWSLSVSGQHGHNRHTASPSRNGLSHVLRPHKHTHTAYPDCNRCVNTHIPK